LFYLQHILYNYLRNHKFSIVLDKLKNILERIYLNYTQGDYIFLDCIKCKYPALILSKKSIKKSKIIMYSYTLCLLMISLYFLYLIIFNNNICNFKGNYN